MKLPRTLLKLKLKAGNLSKSDKVAFLAKEAAKAKPVATHITKALPDVVTSKPILGPQVHATNRERRTLRRLKNTSPFFEVPLASTSPIPSSSASNAEAGSHIEGKISISVSVVTEQGISVISSDAPVITPKSSSFLGSGKSFQEHVRSSRNGEQRPLLS